MKYSGLILLCLFTPVPARAESPPQAKAVSASILKVTLRILAKGKGTPVTKAEVKVGDHKTLSDALGRVDIDVPAAGPGEVHISRRGFEPAVVDFADVRGPGEYEVYLLPGITDDNVIVVRGERRIAVTKKVIPIEEAAKVAPGGDPAQVVKLLPGVQSRGNRPDVIVWGSGPRDSKYYIDDLEVPFIFHNIGNMSVLPGSFLQSVEFESGGFGPEYGDATGGVITLRTRTENPERPLTQFTLNLPFYSGISHERPIGADAGLWVGIRRSYIDVFLSKLLARQNRRGGSRGSLTIAPYFSDAEAIYLSKRDDGYTKLSLLSAYDGLKAAIPSSASQNEDGRANIDFYTAFANVGAEQVRTLGGGWRYRTTPQVYYYKNTADFAGNTDDFVVERVRMPTEFTYRLDKNADLYFGADPAWQIAKSDIYAIQFRRDDPTFDPESAPKVKTVDTEVATSIATWGAIDQTVGPVILTPGVRAFYNSQIRKSAADPRLRGKYAVTDEHTIKAALGQYSESPTPRQASPSRGNPNLSYIRSNHYVMGLETKWNEDWTSEVQAFYKTAVGIIESDPDTNFNNAGSLRSRGATVFLRRNMTGRLFGWLSYTYSHSDQRQSDSLPWHQSTYDQTHVVNLVGDYRFTGTWDLGGRFYYHTGDTYSLVSDTVFNADLDKYSPRPSVADRDAGRIPDFDSLDIYLTHDVLFNDWKLSWRLGVMSWWYKPQVLMVRYNYDYSQAQSITALSTIPFIELKGEI